MRVRVRIAKNRLRARLMALAPEVAKDLRQTNSDLADNMVADARHFAPRRTGDLIDSIVKTPPGQTPPAYSQGGHAVPPDAYAVSAGNSKVRYPHLVEFGTKPHPQGGTGKGTQHPGTARHPYFWPAYRIIRAKHKKATTAAVRRGVKRAIKK